MIEITFDNKETNERLVLIMSNERTVEILERIKNLYPENSILYKGKQVVQTYIEKVKK